MFSSVGGGVDTIRAWVDRIRMSADRLIVSENAIRIFAMTYIVLVLFLHEFSQKGFRSFTKTSLGDALVECFIICAVFHQKKPLKSNLQRLCLCGLNNVLLLFSLSGQFVVKHSPAWLLLLGFGQIGCAALFSFALLC